MLSVKFDRVDSVAVALLCLKRVDAMRGQGE